MREEDKALIAKVLLNHYEILKLVVRQTWWLFVSIVGLAWWLLWMLMTMLARVNDHTTDVVKRDQQQQQQQTRLHAEDMLSSKKWLSINDNHQLVIDEDVGQRVLTTPTTKPQLGGGGVNLAMVFGPLGSGKSFLMNCLAEQSGNKEKCFAVSNMTEACTQGVDICSPFHFFPPARRSTTTTTIPGAYHEESLWKVNTEALFHLAIQSAADTAKLRARNMWQDKEAKYPVSDSGLATTAAGIEQECTALFTKQLVNAAPPGRRDPDVCKSALPPDVTVALADMHSNATLLNEIKKRDRATEAQAAAKLKRDEERSAATTAALNARAEKLEEREKAANEQAVKLERDERAAADEKQRREEARNRTASSSPTYMFSSSSSEHDLFSSSSSDRSSSDSGSTRSSLVVGITNKGNACKKCLKGQNCPHHPRSSSDSGSPPRNLVVGITNKGNACKRCLKGHKCRDHPQQPRRGYHY